MAVDKPHLYDPGIYFLTFTNYKWLHLFAITNSYDLVYNWFDIPVVPDVPAGASGTVNKTPSAKAFTVP